MKSLIPTGIVPSAQPADMTPRQVEREFLGLLEEGAKIRAAGKVKARPRRLLSLGYKPRYRLELFDTVFYLTNVRQNPDLRFFVAYLVRDHRPTRLKEIYPRILYKDVSLIWRSASHVIDSDGEYWIGKGDVTTVLEDGEEVIYSNETTTDLPFEVQTAMETLSRRIRRVPADDVAVELILRKAPSDRIEPYRDFAEPRRKAAADRRNLINGGRSVARFTRKDDPSSLRFVAGFEPDFARGIIETSASTSSMYGGLVRRFRILSKNRKIQYMFMAGPRHVWILPAQATTNEISSYGVRTIDVVADEDLFVPGFEYHFLDDSQDPPVLHSQIPQGFAGEMSKHDGDRADASRWLDQLPVVREFRRKVLASRRRRAGAAA